MLTSDLDFIGYREAFGFGSELDAVVADIERTLLPLDPDLTVAICYHFLNTDSEVLNSVDDSSGSVGDPYRDAAALFARGAKKAQDRESVCDLTLDCIRNNDYGARDPIMGSAADFLKKREFDALLDALRQDFLDAPRTQFASSRNFATSSSPRPRATPNCCVASSTRPSKASSAATTVSKSPRRSVKSAAGKKPSTSWQTSTPRAAGSI